MVERQKALHEWLSILIKHDDFILSPLAADASFRQYFRLEYDGIKQVVMDAPPDKEALLPFIKVAQLLDEAGVLVPKLIAHNETLGFLVLSDLGDTLLLGELSTKNVDDYYSKAINILFKIQNCDLDKTILPAFDKRFMLNEMALCSQWFFSKYLSLELTDGEQNLIQTTFDSIATELASQPLVCIHRDYHSRNLMVMQDKSLAVIDFQDAMIGPVTYDLVSLLKDCYISWPRERILDWVSAFYNQSAYARAYHLGDFIRAFDLCGLQRHLKILGVFSRLNFRDNKPRYLKDLPLTLNYVLECTELYEDLHPLYQFLQKRVFLP